MDDDENTAHIRVVDGEENDDPFEKWYLINENKTLPQIWEFIMNAFTIYSLVATPLM